MAFHGRLKRQGDGRTVRDFGFLCRCGIDGPERHLPGHGSAVSPGPWVLVCGDVRRVDAGEGCGLKQLSRIELEVLHGRGVQDLYVDGLQLNGSVFQGLKLTSNRHQLAALFLLQHVALDDLEDLTDRLDPAVSLVLLVESNFDQLLRQAWGSRHQRLVRGGQVFPDEAIDILNAALVPGVLPEGLWPDADHVGGFLP